MEQNINKLDPPIFVNRQSEFDAAMDQLRKENTLAVDTEANSLYAYQEQVCLIQISTPTADFIIDPLSIENIRSLGDVFNNPAVEKIFHASEYDLLILHDEHKFKFKNLFDTMLAAQILGRTKLGLDALLEEYFGLKVNKKYQRANWGKRPLDADMLRYAQIDTHYLIKIRHALADELKKAGLSSIAKEDFSRACLVHKEPKENEFEPWWRLNGARKLSPKKAAVLKALYQYRDRVAQKRNLPLFKVMSSQALLELAQKCPTSNRQLDEMELTGKKAVLRYAEDLLGVIQNGMHEDPVYPPKRIRQDDSYLAREKALRDWRKKIARRMNVNSAVVLPRELLFSIASENPKTKKSLSIVLKDVPWRLERFGDDILSVLKKYQEK